MRRWSLLVVVLLALLMLGTFASAEEIMKIYFFDVGQADATLLKGPDFTVLIDAGDYRRNDVVPHLKSVGVTELDLLIGTHPHADHIGQFPQVLETFPVREVWMSGTEHTTQTFERAVDAILASEAGYHEPRSGEVFTFGSLRIDVLNPVELTGDIHADGIVLRAVYGNLGIVFTGDAEEKTERAMVARGEPLQAMLLHLGHHGSSTSNSNTLIYAVNPNVVFYSAGEGNPYGHPHFEVIDRIASMYLDIYGTDRNGTIRVETTGRGYDIFPERGTRLGGPLAIREPAPSTTPSEAQPSGTVNINTASVDELQRIIHIGPARAQDIIRLRPFRSVDDLTRVSGIGPARIADIKAQGVAYVD